MGNEVVGGRDEEVGISAPFRLCRSRICNCTNASYGADKRRHTHTHTHFMLIFQILLLSLSFEHYVGFFFPAIFRACSARAFSSLVSVLDSYFLPRKYLLFVSLFISHAGHSAYFSSLSHTGITAYKVIVIDGNRCSVLIVETAPTPALARVGHVMACNTHLQSYACSPTPPAMARSTQTY